MPYIPVEEHLPGITGLLEYRKDSAEPIRELTQFLLRGPNTLTEGERELIATVVSNGNECTFCTAAHTAAADRLLGETETTSTIKKDIDSASLPAKMKALLTIALMVRESGKSVTADAIQKAKDEGATDIEIHDTVLIAAGFCMYNRYVDGLGATTPDDPMFYKKVAEQRANEGYLTKSFLVK